MKGGGSRLNVNTDKPHSLISIKNKVLPTSPPARQSPQAPPTAARSWRPGEREPGSRWWRRAAFPGRASPPPGARPPLPAALRSGLRPRTPRATPPARPPEPAPRVRTPRRTPSCERTRLRLPASRTDRGNSTEARGDRSFLALLARRECSRRSGAHASGRQVRSTRPPSPPARCPLADHGSFEIQHIPGRSPSPGRVRRSACWAGASRPVPELPPSPRAPRTRGSLVEREHTARKEPCKQPQS